MTKKDLWRRLQYYIRETELQTPRRERFSGWSAFGLPDLRGFTPHLRQVNLYREQSLESSSSSSSPPPPPANWLLHDLLHVLFYDFVSLNLGASSWREHERFVENHLASEAFAVLTLDYHILAFDPAEETLTIDLKADEWRRFQTAIPDLRSAPFAHYLVNHYLTGDNRGFESQSSEPRFQNWVGHEVRYAKKQRAYVQMWFDDLMGIPPTHKTVEVLDSAADEAVWELLNLVLYSRENDWQNYVREIKQTVEAETNDFGEFPKYQKPALTPDFRFTDIKALASTDLQKKIDAAEKPNASDLFLIWQILALKKPETLGADQKSLVQKVVAESQRNQITFADWNQVRELARAILGPLAWKAEPLRRSTFYLP